MLNNKNQGIVSLIAKKNMKGNKTRNLLATLAIILTTFMFTTVFSIGCSLAENMAVMMVREQGGRATIFLPQPTDEQIDKIDKAKKEIALQTVGIRIHVDSLLTGTKNTITIDYYDKKEFEENYLPAISDMEGSYPKKENEIMMSISAMEQLGIIGEENGISDLKKGMEITLNLSAGEENFYLSGWFRDYETFSHGCHVFVSEEYVENKGLDVQDKGILSMSAKDGKQEMLLKQLEKLVALRDGQQFQTIADGIDKDSDRKAFIVLVAGLVGLMIILSGYLLIYNIMYISVSKDIRFYGLLKAIGATPAQLSRIVRQQVWRLSVIGIPIGFFLGTVSAFVAVPTAVRMFTGSIYSSMPNEVKFRPVIYVGTILFAFATVVLSCRKPAKKASDISPVEAMKYHGINHSQLSSTRVRRKRNFLWKKFCKKKREDSWQTRHGGKPYKMAWRNVFRERKRAVLVFASLFLGIMTFVSVHVFFGCITLENYINTYLPYDYEIFIDTEEDMGYDSEIAGYDSEAVERLLEKLTGIRGVTGYQLNRSVIGILDYRDTDYTPVWEEAVQEYGQTNVDYMLDEYAKGADIYCCQVLAVEEEMIERYNKKAYQPIDLERFRKGEVCLIGRVKEKTADAMLGKVISITDERCGQVLEVEIGSADVSGYGLQMGGYWCKLGSLGYIIISQDAMDQLSPNPAIDTIIMNCEKEAESYVTSQVKKLTENNLVVDHCNIKSESIEGFQSSMTAMNVLTSGISIVLILIGVLNFVNVMLTGVYSRRKELAMLESIGMTKKQNCRMLMCEGIYYGAITVGLILTLGSGIIGLVAMMSMEIADYAIFYYPWKLLLVVAVVIFVICILVPIMVYINVSKESVVDRLRAIE